MSFLLFCLLVVCAVSFEICNDGIKQSYIIKNTLRESFAHLHPWNRWWRILRQCSQPRRTIVQRKQKVSRPNVILFVSDDQGWSNVGYHNVTANTPNINSLARDGIRLERHYSYPFCAPSRTSLLTGRYFHNIMSRVELCDSSYCNNSEIYEHFIPHHLHSVAHFAKHEGYTTYHVGKWGVGSSKEWMLPWKRGFDFSFGFLKDYNSYFASEPRCHFCGKQPCLDAWNHSKTNSNFVNLEGYRPYIHRSEAIRYIDAHPTDTPMFMYIATQTMHPPLEIPKAFRTPNMTDRQVGDVMNKMTDDFVGAVVSALKIKSMWSNTIFIYLSDNGGNFLANNAPLRGGKGTSFEGGVRTPAFVSGGYIPNHRRGLRLHGLIQITDWFTTILNFIGLEADSDGYSHVQYLLGQDKVSRRKRVILLKKDGGTIIENNLLKYILYYRHGILENDMLFNISVDPSEKYPLKNMSVIQKKYKNTILDTSFESRRIYASCENVSRRIYASYENFRTKKQCFIQPFIN